MIAKLLSNKGSGHLDQPKRHSFDSVWPFLKKFQNFSLTMVKVGGAHEIFLVSHERLSCIGFFNVHHDFLGPAGEQAALNNFGRIVMCLINSTQKASV